MSLSGASVGSVQRIESVVASNDLIVVFIIENI